MNECRLCSSRVDLINIFDSNLKNSRELRCFIILATGIEIRETDIVSKLVCRRCCILAIKIYKYRTKAVANDKILKELCGQHYSPPPSPPLSPFNTCKNQNNGDSSEIENTTNKNAIQNTKFGSIKKHPSVEELMNLHPNIILPPRIFRSHINPVITIDKNEVIEWFRNRDNSKCDPPLVAFNECYSKLKNVTIRKVISGSENDEAVNKDDDASINQTINKECYENSLNKNVNEEDDTSNSNKYNSCVAGTKCAIVPNNVARKKTSGIRTFRRKMERKKKAYDASDSDIELQPTAKRKNPTMTSEIQKEIFTSSLGLTPSEKQPINKQIESDFIDKTLSSPGKSTMFETFKEVNLFVCNICNRVCDTKKELTEHQRTHLYCKFCKTKVKSIDALLEHNNETCFVNLTKNLPNVVLIRVDKDPKIIDKYGRAFDILKDEQEESDDEIIIPLIEEVNVPVGGDEFFDEMQTNPENLPSYENEIVMAEPRGKVNLTDPMLRSVLGNNSSSEKQKVDSKLEQYIEKSIGMATHKLKRKKESYIVSSSSENVVCISDESDDETTTNKSTKITSSKTDVTVVPLPIAIESVSIIRPEINVAQNTIICPQAAQNINSKSLASLEESIIQELFKKYSISKSTNRTTQVFLPSDSSIKVLGNKLMSVENMFLELSMHKVPVELNCSDTIKIDFKSATEKTPYKSDFSWNKCSVNELMPQHLSTTMLKLQPTSEVIQIEDDGYISAPATTTAPVRTTASKWAVVSKSGTFIRPTVLLNGSNFLPDNSNNSSSSSNNQTMAASVTIPLVSLPIIPSSSNDQTKSITQCNNTVQVVVPSSNAHLQTVSVSQNQVQVPTSSNTILLNHINAINRPSTGQKLLLPTPLFSSPNILQHRPSLAPNITIPKTQTQSQTVAPVTNNCGKVILVTQNNKTLDQNDINASKEVESSPVVMTSNCPITTENTAAQGNNGPSLLRVRNLWELTGHRT